MKKILVPCDFSKPSINAYQFALNVASQSRGTVNLLYVVELPVLHDSMLMPVLSVEQDFMNDLKDKMEEKFEKLIEKSASGKVKVRSEVVFGPVDRMIVNYADEKGLDVIIMGTHGATGIKGFFIGSNAEKVVRNARVPVFALKDVYKRQIKNIVFPVPFDFFDDLKELITRVKSVQSFFGAHLYLVRINTPGTFASDADTMKKLDDLAKRYGLKNFSMHIFNDFDERSGIINFTEIYRADLIMMGTRGRKGIAHLFNGSIAEDVVNKVRYPIVTYNVG
jgi:nucleotide-binding universal stress UspA family protein